MNEYHPSAITRLNYARVLSALLGIASGEPEPGPELWLRTSPAARDIIVQLRHGNNLDEVIEKARRGALNDLLPRWRVGKSGHSKKLNLD